MKPFTALNIFLALSSVGYAGELCGGVMCTSSAPCCRGGACGSAPYYCAAAVCESSRSFSYSSCWPKNQCSSTTYTFTNASELKGINNLNGGGDKTDFVSVFSVDNTAISDGNMVLGLIPQGGDLGVGSTVTANFEVLYGVITARVKTGSSAPGVVSAIVLRSTDTQDEIDFEWVGKAPNLVQTNYFYRGELVYTNAGYHDIGVDASADYHDYTIEWYQDKINFVVDGKIIRVINRADTFDPATGKYKFPDTAMEYSFSLWDGGGSSDQGTREWAGYPTPYHNGVGYRMYIQSCTFSCGPDGRMVASSSSSTSSSSSSSSSSPSSSLSISSSSSTVDESSSDSITASDSSQHNSQVITTEGSQSAASSIKHSMFLILSMSILLALCL